MSRVSELWDAIVAFFSPTAVGTTTVACPGCAPQQDPGSKIRAEIVEGMRLANRRPGGIDYPDDQHPYYLDSNYWVQTDPGNFSWKLKPGVKPSEAVERIFQYDSGSRMECNSVISAVYYRAILKTVGPDKFDKMFQSGLEISADKDNPTRKFMRYKPTSQGLKAGDWVYDRGHPDYDSPDMNAVLGSGAGAWRGENAIVGSNGTLSGLGLSDEPQDEMTRNLLGVSQNGQWTGGYNEKVDEYNARRPPGTPAKPYGRIGDMPGLASQVAEPDVDAIMKAATQ